MKIFSYLNTFAVSVKSLSETLSLPPRSQTLSFPFKTFYSVFYFTYFKIFFYRSVLCLYPPAQHGPPYFALSVVRGVWGRHTSWRLFGTRRPSSRGSGWHRPPIHAVLDHSLGQGLCRGRMDVLGVLLGPSRSRPGLWLPL